MDSVSRFYVDLSYLRSPTTGVAVYAIRLAQHLERHFRCKVIASKRFAEQFEHVVIVPDPLQVRRSVIARAPLGRPRKGLFLTPHDFVYAPHMRPILGTAHQVVTVHDLIHHFHPTRNAVENAYNRFVLPRLLRRLPAVFTVSSTSKRAICDFYGLEPQAVQVVPNGIDLADWRPSGRAPASDPAYLLIVSANRPYKNTVEVLERHHLWRHQYRLVIVNTGGRYGGVVRASIQRLGLQSVVDERNGVSESELIRLYQDCTATVYPSLMEGFGRPALESMAVGRPVILSDIPVHKENFGSAAIFVSPGDETSWRRAFTLLGTRDHTQNVTQLGSQLAQRFSWGHSGNRLVESLLRLRPRLRALERR